MAPQVPGEAVEPGSSFSVTPTGGLGVRVPKGGVKSQILYGKCGPGAGAVPQMCPVAVWGSLWELLFEGSEVQIGTHFPGEAMGARVLL